MDYGLYRKMDSQKFLEKFVKIVEQYPVLYDPKLPDRTPHLCSLTWEKVAEQVRKQLDENATVEELKLKWKGIRSSFSRFKRKMESKQKDGTKQYYLYEHLMFLLPHTKTRGRHYCELDRNDDQSSEGDEWDSEVTGSFLNEDSTDHINSSVSNPLSTTRYIDNIVYPDVKIEPIEEDTGDVFNISSEDKRQSADSLKRKSAAEVFEATTSKVQKKQEESADLQFLKSILPDIENFTKQEKRKFKMGVLKLIDDIESGRRDVIDKNN